jgi:hypothetical protein
MVNDQRANQIANPLKGGKQKEKRKKNDRFRNSIILVFAVLLSLL